MSVGNQHNPARCPEHVSVFFFPKVKQLIMNTTQESAPRQRVGRWQGVWEDTGRYLPWLSLPMVLNFTPGQG